MNFENKKKMLQTIEKWSLQIKKWTLQTENPKGLRAHFHRPRALVSKTFPAHFLLHSFRHARAVAQNPRALKNGRGKVRFYLLSWRIHFRTENKNTAQKTERDVRLLERFLKTKDEDRKIEDIPAAELNEFISEFIISVRTKVRVRVRVRVCTLYALFTWH